jgi:hypothetical protein
MAAVSDELPGALTAVAAALAEFKAEAASAPPALREWMLRLISTLDKLLAVLSDDEDDDEDQAAEDSRRLGEIRALLAGFDWETGDRRDLLEAIELAADGGA